MDDEHVWERYSRQMLFAPVGREGQKRLLDSRVAVIGLGALGTVLANNLARAGVGYLKLVDRDFVEASNLQRQILFDESDVEDNLPKSIAAVNKLKKINSQIRYEGLVEDLNFTNIFDILEDIDLVVDGTDNLETRYLMNEACVKLKLPWIHGACAAGSGTAFTIRPGETACFACLWGEAGGQLGETCDTAGILGPLPSIVASLQSVEAIKLLTGASAALQGKLLFFDVWENSITCAEVPKRDGCRVCSREDFQYISGEKQLRSTYLCGRDAVQVLPPVKLSLSLKDLGEKLAPLGRVFVSPYLVKFSTGPHELIIFSDGRALVKGTSDEKIARSLYSRYLGA